MNPTDLQTLCSAWPGAANSIKWEDDLVFTVAGKMFAVYSLRGPHRNRISFKVDPERFLELTDQPGIMPAAYMARAFWITIAEPDRFASTKITEFVRHSYDLVRGGLSKKQQALLAAIEGEGAKPAAKSKTPAKSAPMTKPKPLAKQPVNTAAKPKPRKV